MESYDRCLSRQLHFEENAMYANSISYIKMLSLALLLWSAQIVPALACDTPFS